MNKDHAKGRMEELARNAKKTTGHARRDHEDKT
jgi:hypothetical protein